MKNTREVSLISDSVGFALLDANGIAVTIINRSGSILFVNETASLQYGKSANEIMGCCVWDLYPEASKNHHKIVVHEVIETGSPISLRYKDQAFWKQLLIYPIKKKDKRVNSIALCVYDITLQLTNEERLKHVLLELVTAQEDERHRISRDLHDDVGQKMTALVLELRAIKETVEAEQMVSLTEINGVIRNMDDIIKHVRQIFYQLHPPSLSRMALPKVLAAFCTTFEETNGVHVDFSCQEVIPELPDNYDNAIYRFVQEGLTNVSKHARASSAWLNLDYTDGDLNISLEDNGQGFDLQQMVEGIGLRGIRERFILLGGTIDIESAQNEGTRIFGTIPFERRNF